MDRRKKKTLTAILLLLLIAVYLLIFRFSADDGENSSLISMKVSETAVSLYYKLFGGGMDAAFVTGTAAGIEGAVRKLAHFTEYMTVGFLAGTIWSLWMYSGWKCTLAVLVQLLLSAGLDELHQYFVPGRHASLWDVAIDAMGGLAGFAIVLCLKGLTKVWNHIRRRESETCF